MDQVTDTVWVKVTVQDTAWTDTVWDIVTDMVATDTAQDTDMDGKNNT